MAMGFIEKIRTVLLHPSKFFENIKSEKGIVEAFKYTFLLNLIGLVVNLIGAFPPFSSTVDVVAMGVAVLLYLIGLLGLFVTSGIVHLFAMLLGGKGKYSTTYKAMAYGDTPSLLLGWIPFAGFIFYLYALYLSIKGVSILHKISMLRAIVAILALIIIIVIISAILGSVISLWLYSFIQSSL